MTDFRAKYSNGTERTEFLANLYTDYLRGSVLDVGAGPCTLKGHLPSESSYTSVGLDSHHNIKADLEQPLPIDDNQYDCVFCSHVLEHIDHVHMAFGELCRVSNKYVVIGLPNPYSIFASRLLRGKDEDAEFLMFHHNLPQEHVASRHKWFYSTTEARRFVDYNAKKSGFRVEEHDYMRRGLLQELFVKMVFGAITIKSGVLPELLVGDMSWVLVNESDLTD